MRVLAVLESGLSWGGGPKRALRSVLSYIKRGLKVSVLILTDLSNAEAASRAARTAAILISHGARVCGVSDVGFLNRRWPTLARYMAPLLRPRRPLHRCYAEEFDAVIATDSVLPLLGTALAIKGGKKIAILQEPFFYGNRKRLRNIVRASELWHALVERSITRLLGLRLSHVALEALWRAADPFGGLYELIHGPLLKRFDLLIAVSRATVVEMGVNWGHLKALDPGVSLDEEDVKLIEKARRTQARRGYFIFSANPVASKGVVEAILAFAIIARRRPNARLVVTGRADPRLAELAKRLGVGDKVFFTGYLSQDELFKARAAASALIYPSHTDAFSYTVLETLALGVPVVAYDIPALRINFFEKGAQGLALVKELDVEGLADVALNMLDEKIEVSPPQIPSWDEIIDKEVELIQN